MRADLRLLPSPVRGFGCEFNKFRNPLPEPTDYPKTSGEQALVPDARATPSTPRGSELWRMSVTRRFATPRRHESPSQTLVLELDIAGRSHRSSVRDSHQRSSTVVVKRTRVLACWYVESFELENLY